MFSAVIVFLITSNQPDKKMQTKANKPNINNWAIIFVFARTIHDKSMFVPIKKMTKSSVNVGLSIIFLYDFLTMLIRFIFSLLYIFAIIL